MICMQVQGGLKQSTGWGRGQFFGIYAHTLNGRPMYERTDTFCCSLSLLRHLVILLTLFVMPLLMHLLMPWRCSFVVLGYYEICSKKFRDNRPYSTTSEFLRTSDKSSESRYVLQ